MAKIDHRRELKDLYVPPKDAPVIVDVPEMTFLMVDGSGDPNTAESYREAVESLFAVSYAIKFAVKRRRGVDYGVMPLEGLWWVEDMSTFTVDDKSAWSWTAMVPATRGDRRGVRRRGDLDGDWEATPPRSGSAPAGAVP
jgi:hypothetical protein